MGKLNDLEKYLEFKSPRAAYGYPYAIPPAFAPVTISEKPYLKLG